MDISCLEEGVEASIRLRVRAQGVRGEDLFWRLQRLGRLPGGGVFGQGQKEQRGGRRTSRAQAGSGGRGAPRTGRLGPEARPFPGAPGRIRVGQRHGGGSRGSDSTFPLAGATLTTNFTPLGLKEHLPKNRPQKGCSQVPSMASGHSRTNKASVRPLRAAGAPGLVCRHGARRSREDGEVAGGPQAVEGPGHRARGAGQPHGLSSRRNVTHCNDLGTVWKGKKDGRNPPLTSPHSLSS